MMRSGRPRFRIGLVGWMLVVAVTAGASARVVPAAAAERPNVVLIVTDDQRWDSLWAMPNVRELLVDRGGTFTDAVVSNPLCCPSRAATSAAVSGRL